MQTPMPKRPPIKPKPQNSARQGPVPYVPFVKDRVQLSSDVVEAYLSQEPALEVHKRSPHTTYLSEIDSLLTVMHNLAISESKAAASQSDKQPAQSGRKTKAGSKSKPRLRTCPATIRNAG